MFWSLIGAGVLLYGLFYVIVLIFIDCDLQLAFYEKFGKSISMFWKKNEMAYTVKLFLGRLKGKVVFITGASSGIGEHTAIAFAKHGVKLVLVARRRDELERVKNKCLGMLEQFSNFCLQMYIKQDLCVIVEHNIFIN